RKWLPANSAPLVVAKSQPDNGFVGTLLLRNRDVGDMDGDGVEEYVLDFVDWAPFMMQDGANGSMASPLRLAEEGPVGALFFSLPEVTVADCTACSRPPARGFHVARLRTKDGLYVIDGSLANVSNMPGSTAASAGYFRAMGKGIIKNTNNNTTRSFATVGVTSQCLFPLEDCDMYELTMQAEGADLVIKVKSSPP
ncbi:MAG: hypothetical protein AB1730_15805, partial [Myxococcota bacterium]